MAIMSAVVYYILPGLIGRAYDLKNDTVGPDLFDLNTIHTRTIDHYQTTAEYSIVSDKSEARDFLDVNGKLDIKIKSGKIHLSGSGEYMKQTGSFKNKIELLVKVHFETVTETLPSDVKPLPDWRKIIERTGNTHYIRSITYGGDLIASLSFHVLNEADKERIKGVIQGELSSKSGSFAGSVKGGLEKIMNETKDSASMSINYYATVPLDLIPRTMEDLIELIEIFPNQTKKVNNGKGNPVQMEVFSLEGLSKDKKAYYQTQTFAHMMDVLSEQFSDIKTARSRLHDWMNTLPPMLSDEVKRKISDFSSRLHAVAMVFSDVVSQLDLSNDASPDQFHKAYEAYIGDEPESYPDMYVIKLSKLKVDVMSSVLEFQADFGGAIYTHWGANLCPSTSHFVSNGRAFITSKNTIGSTRFLCIPEKRDYIPIEEDVHKEEELIADFPEISPVVFRTRSDKGLHDQNFYISCATCRLPGKTLTTMLPGKNECPPGWAMQYRGVLISTLMTQPLNQLLCFNTIEEKYPADLKIDSTVILSEISTFRNMSGRVSLGCAVCSKVKETKLKDEVHNQEDDVHD